MSTSLPFVYIDFSYNSTSLTNENVRGLCNWLKLGLNKLVMEGRTSRMIYSIQEFRSMNKYSVWVRFERDSRMDPERLQESGDK